jgi:hypothetical protein
MRDAGGESQREEEGKAWEVAFHAGVIVIERRYEVDGEGGLLSQMSSQRGSR